jgi:U3 small nucleolar RNA-associated protein 5
VPLSKDVSSGLVEASDGGPVRCYLLSQDFFDSLVQSTSQKRYVETPHLAVRSGFDPDQDRDFNDIPTRGMDGDLDVDLAELSLGQRLTALSGGADLDGANSGTSSVSENETPKDPTVRRRQKTRTGKENDADHLPVPAHSLSRTLVQALHSADTRLLETCLLHSDELLVMNTVRRLPPQLAVPLLTACVERLGRGARANTAKGGGGGASAQRGTGLIRWIRAVLVVHAGHLMTVGLSALYLSDTDRP